MLSGYINPHISIYISHSNDKQDNIKRLKYRAWSYGYKKEMIDKAVIEECWKDGLYLIKATFPLTENCYDLTKS